MNKIKSALIILAALSMLAACGESFRAKQIETVPTTNGGTINDGTDGTNVNPPIIAQPDTTPLMQQFTQRDQDFADRYQSLLQNTAGTNTIRTLVRALGVTKRLASLRFAGESFGMSSRNSV